MWYNTDYFQFEHNFQWSIIWKVVTEKVVVNLIKSDHRKNNKIWTHHQICSLLFEMLQTEFTQYVFSFYFSVKVSITKLLNLCVKYVCESVCCFSFFLFGTLYKLKYLICMYLQIVVCTVENVLKNKNNMFWLVCEECSVLVLSLFYSCL